MNKGYRNLSKGYQFQLRDIFLDNALCSAKLTFFREGKVVEQLNEVEPFISHIIEHLMNNDLLGDPRIKAYETIGCIEKDKDWFNLYWGVKLTTHGKWDLLIEFCDGAIIEVKSGPLEGKKGIYRIFHTGKFFSKYKQFVEYNNELYNLQGEVFEFIKDDTQNAWESIIEAS
jgi:hypothetical protein